MKKITANFWILVFSAFVTPVHAQIMARALNQDKPVYENIRLMPNLSNLPPGFNRVSVEALNQGQWEQVAVFYVLGKTNPHAKVDFLTAKKSPQFFDGKPPNFQGIYDSYRKLRKSVGLVIAGAFESSDKSRTLEGFALDHGSKVGRELILGGRHNTLFEITPWGEPKLHDLFGMDMESAKKITQRLIDDQSSAFQQFPVVRNSKVVLTSDEQHFYRFYVEQQHWFMDKNFKGVLNFTKLLSLTDAAAIATKIKTDNSAILNAVYLDVGGLSEGAEFSNGGELTPISDSVDTLGDVIEWFSSDHYTNLLVFYSDR